MNELITPERATQYLATNVQLHDALGLSADIASRLRADWLAQGEHNANFVFDCPGQGKLVLRVNYFSQMNLDDQIGYEYDALRFLEPSGVTPQTLFVDRSKQLGGHGALVMRHYEGHHIELDNSSEMSIAAQLMANYHSVPADETCPLLHPGDPLKAQFDTCCGFVSEYKGSSCADPMVVRYLDRMLAKAQDMLSTPFDVADSYHALNTEAVPSHFLISNDGKSGRMLDWEKPILGEVAQDVAYFLSPTTTIWDTDVIFDMPQREQFVQEYWKTVDGRFPMGRFEDRFEAYVVMNCLVGITWSCNAMVEYQDPNKLLKNQKTVEKLKIYLSEEFLDLVFSRHFAGRVPNVGVRQENTEKREGGPA